MLHQHFVLDQDLESRIKGLIKLGNTQYIPSSNLRPNISKYIRAGIAGGLPFDTLVSDVTSGCLPKHSACYGMCFAAKSSWEKGIDFGKRSDNILDESRFLADITALPQTQNYLRCGWNSDPSWNWEMATRLAELVQSRNKILIFITKAFTNVPRCLYQRMIKAKSEMRVSISALDTNNQLAQRLAFIEQYRNLGGTVIPILLTAAFNNKQLLRRQEALVEWIIEHDYPAAENSLRFPIHAPMTSLIAREKAQKIKDRDEVWSGRLYEKQLVIPTTTSVPPTYAGLPNNHLSQIQPAFIDRIFFDPVTTHQTVMSSEELHQPPRMCGVADETF